MIPSAGASVAHSMERVEFTEQDFRRIAALVYHHAGITLAEGKEVLVRSRLNRTLQNSGADSYGAYLDEIEADPTGQKLSSLIDLLTTNKTSFFREAAHFDYLTDAVLPELASTGEPIRIWSAGCSTGEEPYTLSMLLAGAVPRAAAANARILATDISSRVLDQARIARYPDRALVDVPIEIKRYGFRPLSSSISTDYLVADEVRDRVHFARLNLMDEWPMKRPFHVIFCRNVMIYFDRQTQQRLVQRFWNALAPGGYLFVGHSEGLTSLSHQFQYVRPAVYVKS